MNEKINKLVDYCKEHQINEEEGIQIIHAFLNRKGYTRTKWKKVKFGLYADARIQHNGDTTSSGTRVLFKKHKLRDSSEK